MRVLAVLALLVAAFSPSTVSASTVAIEVVELSARSVMTRLAEDAGTIVEFVDFEDFKVENWSFQGSYEDALKQLSERHGFFFVYDGIRYVVSNKNLGVSVVMVEPSRTAKLNRAVDTLFPIRSDRAMTAAPDAGLVILRGSQDYIDTVKELAAKSAADKVRFIRFGIRTIDRPPEG